MTSKQPTTIKDALQTWDSARVFLHDLIRRELHRRSYAQSYERALALAAARSALDAVICPDLRALDLLAMASALPSCGPCDAALFSHALSLFREVRTSPLSYELIDTTVRSTDRFAFWQAQETLALNACAYAVGCLLTILGAPISRSSQYAINAVLESASSLGSHELAISALTAPLGLGPTPSVIIQWSRARTKHLYNILSVASVECEEKVAS